MDLAVVRNLFALMMLAYAGASFADDTDLFKLDGVLAPARIMLMVDSSGSMARPEGNSNVEQSYSGDCTGQGSYTVQGIPVFFDNASRKICVVRDILLNFLDPEKGVPGVAWPDNFEVGLAKYSQQGAVIIVPMGKLGKNTDPNSNRTRLLSTVKDLDASGWTPLVGSYLEMAEYLTGGQAVTMGVSGTDPDVWVQSTIPNSPNAITDGSYLYKGVELGPQCGNVNNHLVFLTDGESTCEKGSRFEDDEFGRCPSYSGHLMSGDLGTRVNKFVSGKSDEYNEECDALIFSSYEEKGEPYKSYWGCLSLVSGALSRNTQLNNERVVNAGVITHVIAYDMEGASSNTTAGMEAWATASGGRYVSAKTGMELSEAFKQISSEVVMPGSFVVASSGVAVSQLNRFSHIDELYFSMFTPSGKPFWYGNLKKYFFNLSEEGELDIYTKANKSERAVQNGVFLPNVLSEWSDPNNIPDTFAGVDGDVAHVGGAASRIKNPENLPPSERRKLIAYYGSTKYELGPDSIVALNEDIDKLKTSLLSDYAQEYEIVHGDAADPEVLENYNDEVVAPSLNWLLGLDVNNEWGRIIQNPDPEQASDSEDSRAEAYKGVRNLYGAPLHSSPTLVNYLSRDAEGEPLAEPKNIVFVSTNDGKLYAVDAKSGDEQLAYIPEAMLKRSGLEYPSPLEKMFEATKPNAADGRLIYGLDSTWTVWRQDVDANGNIDVDTRDFVYLYGGMRRGGRNYYILDATKVEDSADLEEVAVIKGGENQFLNNGESWSEPKLAIVNYKGTPTAVFIVGGGYDPVYDIGRPETLPAKGAQVYIISARDFYEKNGGAFHSAGEVLWWASSESLLGDNTHVQIEALKYSIPSSVKTVDIDANGYLDFFYVGDMGGQIHRFDIDNESTEAKTLVSNAKRTVVAQLGIATDEADLNSQKDDRRFFYPPSIAKMNCPEGYCMALAVGSGWRSNPTDISVTEKFYFLMDYEPFVPGQAQDLPVITDLSIEDGGTVLELDKISSQDAITAASTAKGIRGYSLALGGTGYEAEKLLGSPLIVGGSAYFSTYYRPAEAISTDTCQVGEGASAVYQFTPGDAQALLLKDQLSQNVAGSIQSLIVELTNTGEVGDGETPTQSGTGLQGGIVSGTGSVGPAPLRLNHIRKTRWEQMD